MVGRMAPQKSPGLQQGDHGTLQGTSGRRLNWLGNDRRESLQDAGCAGKTVWSYVKDLGAVYWAAIREGLVSFNPYSTAAEDEEEV
ncbi:MAG: hypothetical protein WEB53_04605 [Akkermansiaceae bacterium]